MAAFLDDEPRQSERGWMNNVLALLRMFGWAWWHDQATNAPRQCPRCKLPIKLPRNLAGFPDLLVIRGDTLIVVELKSDRGRVRPEQQDWLDAFRAVKKVKVFVWRPRDVQAVTEELR